MTTSSIKLSETLANEKYRVGPDLFDENEAKAAWTTIAARAAIENGSRALRARKAGG
jgi:hypothetical protein